MTAAEANDLLSAAVRLWAVAWGFRVVARLLK